jgi:uncharacterized membrane protein YraQ (UPF0718 family)
LDSTRYDRAVWDWLVWGALAAVVVAAIAGAVVLGVAVLRFFRDLKRSRRAIFRELDRIAATAAEIGEHVTEAGAASERLSGSLARLAASRRRLAVLQSALDEVEESFGWALALYPRK